ncbi:hypothetical protein BD410DRAFT_829181 [Rickenella mellea]|uniref:Uncharacterized protein n=1 Tax=Rickenella mellea TaxID=50990 RepID=A0A4Y7Q203_9AGAM|nr:hypothetical protein BD410DRAFT_829181 [Rickenella mellea]
MRVHSRTKCVRKHPRVRRPVYQGGRETRSADASIGTSRSSTTSSHVSPLSHAPTDEAQHVPKAPDLSSVSGEPVPEGSAVYEKAILHGHSTPDMAGAFAKRVQAQSLYLNHFSVKYEWHQSQYQLRKRVMAEIERQATQAWLGERERPVAVAARDHMVVDVPFRDESSGR